MTCWIQYVCNILGGLASCSFRQGKFCAYHEGHEGDPGERGDPFEIKEEREDGDEPQREAARTQRHKGQMCQDRSFQAHEILYGS
jgi:hypothetical protein